MPPIQFLPLSAAPQALYRAAVLTHSAALAGAYISSQPTKPAKAVNCILPRLAATNYCSSTAQCVLREWESCRHAVAHRQRRS